MKPEFFLSNFYLNFLLIFILEWNTEILMKCNKIILVAIVNLFISSFAKDKHKNGSSGP